VTLNVQQTLQDEIKEASRWVNTADGVYKRDLVKRIELMKWALEQINNPHICAVMESKMNQVINEINKKKSIVEKDPLDSELRILDWIFLQVCKDQQNRLFQNI
jgi:hypothetical protein